ncbi:MAG TPA: TolC family protein [Pyrinomonadaceae bacterium]|nr:TolC family protein [Pyrinomonadaceae bacterium]
MFRLSVPSKLCCLTLLLCLLGQTARLNAQQPQPSPPEPYYDYPYGSDMTMRRTLTVDEAVTLALANASLYQQSRLEEESAREDVRQARAAFLPQFSIPLGYIGTTPSQVRAPGEPLTFSFVSASAINETTAFLNATGPVDLSGKLRASLRRSRALLAATRAGTLMAKRELTLSTVDAYYGLVLARQKRRLADETLSLAEAFVNLALRRRARGEGEEADIYRIRSAAATRRDELEQARLAESAAMSLLRVLTGVDFVTHIGVARLTEDVPSVADFLSYTEEMVKLRPELDQLDAQQQAAREEARLARRELFPELTYSFNAGFDTADIRRLRQYSGGSAIISLNIPLWNFGASKSRETQARLRARSLDLQREYTVQRLRQEFYDQRAAAMSALARIKLAETAANSAQQNLNLIFVRYRQNEADITDVIDAQGNSALTRLAYYQAIADYRTARVRLEIDPSQRATAAQEAAPPRPLRTEPGDVKCSLTGSQQPLALAGLRLGMTPDQASLLFPGLTLEGADESGVAKAFIDSRRPANRSSANTQGSDVETIDLEFTDGRASFIRLNYQPTGRWESIDQFLSVTAVKLGLTGDWKPFYEWRDKGVRDLHVLKDVALECDEIRLSMGIGLEGIGVDQSPHIALEDLKAARVVQEREDAKKREQNEAQKAKP